MGKKHDLEILRKNSETISDYVSSVGERAPAFIKRKADYKLDEPASEKLKKRTEDVVLFVFSAEWCPDCHRNVPVLGLIAESTGMEIRVFGHLMRDLKNPKEVWRIPPSPPEVRDFNVRKIPLIIVFNKDGKKIGEIVENPPEGKSLEETLLGIVLNA